MRRRLRWVGAGILGLGLVISIVVTLATALLKLPGEETIPAGMRRSSSRYLEMRDGVAIATSVYLPSDLKAGERVPVLMRTTRYWREPEIGRALRLLVVLHLASPEDLFDKQVAYFNQRHFAVLLVDARGTGASGGNRVIEYSTAEVLDMGEVAAWAGRQPWSNGRVGTFGISYEGNTAELAAIPRQPAVRAVMPLYGTFDNWENIGEGGVAFQSFLYEWSNIIAALDRNDVCGAEEVKGWNCWKTRLLTPGVRPVDEDADGRQLAQMVGQHRNFDVAEAIRKVEFRDDPVATDEGTLRLADISPSGLRQKIEASQVPMMVWCGWFDGNPEGPLIRYRTFSNPQVLVIGPLSHGGDFNVDPFAPKHTPPVPSSEEQFKMEADFFDRILRSDIAEPVDPSIQYYTMGEERWHTTKTWPPPGLSAERLYFREQNALNMIPPSAAGASDVYSVDFTASSGQQTRWHTGLGGGDVVYPDRAEEDKKLLAYTSGPLESDLEITGSPVLTIEMSSTSSDGAVHAYLEDVAPEGRVTYVDEGILRLIDRKEVDPKTLPYEPLGPAHSFLRKDAEPLNSNESVTVRFSLYPTSVLLRKGHRIRIALAGADSGFFQRYPAVRTATWTVYRETHRASFIELPVRRGLGDSR